MVFVLFKIRNLHPKNKELRPTEGTVAYNCSQETQKELRVCAGVCSYQICKTLPKLRPFCVVQSWKLLQFSGEGGKWTPWGWGLVEEAAFSEVIGVP